jgi:hypothetical protein
MFFRHQLGPFDLWYVLDLGFIFCLGDLAIDDSGELKSPYTTVLELIYAFRSYRVCLMKLGTYRLITVISFWSISPFITM